MLGPFEHLVELSGDELDDVVAVYPARHRVLHIGYFDFPNVEALEVAGDGFANDEE
jgi:hypothetical protein